MDETLTASQPETSAPEEPAELCPRPCVVPDDLLAAVDTGPRVSLDDIAEQISQARMVVVRVTGIALQTLLVLLTSLTFHVLAVGGGAVLVYFGAGWIRQQADALPRAMVSIEIDEGGRGTGGMPRGTAPTMGDAQLAQQEINEALRPAGGAERLGLPIPTLIPRQSPIPLPDSPPLIALQGAPAPEVPRVKLPTRPMAVAETPRDVGGPRIDQVNGPALASAGKAASVGTGAQALAHTLGPGLGGGDEDDDQIRGFVKAGKGGGVGRGTGSGRGNGIDRGPSVADTRAKLLDAPRLRLPEQYARGMVPIRRDVIFGVTIDAEGHPTSVTLKQSCGDHDLDEIIRRYYAAAKYSPAYRAGRPIVSTEDFGFGPGGR